MSEITEKRIEDIEIKLAYMEEFVNQLQEVTVTQSKMIDKLMLENKAMVTKIKEMADNQEGNIPNVRPPHY